MPDPASMQLTRTQRRHLLSALETIPFFDTPAGRNLLLADLPRSLVRGITRSDNTKVDLFNLVQAVEDWGQLDDGASALLVLLQNALDHSRGTAPGRELQALYDELSSQLAQFTPLRQPLPV